MAAKRKNGMTKPKRMLTKIKLRAARKSRKIKHSRNKGPVQLLPISDYALQSYEHALVNDIINNKAELGPSSEAVNASSILLNLTKSTSDSTFISGIRIGRIIYGFSSKSAQSVQNGQFDTLIRFFENAGYKVSYNSFPGTFSINLYYNGSYLGIKGHNFEAGIIEGFLNASGYYGMHVSEKKCIMEGFQYCSFVASYNPVQRYIPEESILKAAIHEASKSISNKVMLGRVTHDFNPSYIALRNMPALSQGDDVAIIRCASSIAKEVEFRSIISNGGLAAKGAIERTISLLNIGRINVKSLKPIKLELYMDILASGRLSVAFAKAFISGVTGEPIAKINEYVTENGSCVISLGSAKN
ncbi:MAG: hypothetical protein QXN59_01590 [Candidatus Micrarchaeaceae archaeon]